jgi:hypothetical protein
MRNLNETYRNEHHKKLLEIYTETCEMDYLIRKTGKHYQQDKDFYLFIYLK